MKFNVLVTDNFERKVKKLSRKYKSLKADLEPVFVQLETTPNLGIAIGNDCFKIRVAIKSKRSGKSGGARIITYVRYLKGSVYLIDIYDKSQKTTISEKEIIELVSIILG
jgi:mRNA-degrading endonuclease RelE of RelBE toxin-antitoxin system